MQSLAREIVDHFIWDKYALDTKHTALPIIYAL